MTVHHKNSTRLEAQLSHGTCNALCRLIFFQLLYTLRKSYLKRLT